MKTNEWVVEVTWPQRKDFLCDAYLREVYKRPVVKQLQPFLFPSPDVVFVRVCPFPPPFPQVCGRHGALEAAVPAAALAFAAAAAAPGSAAAPPSGLSHGVSTGSDLSGREPLGRRGLAT